MQEPQDAELAFARGDFKTVNDLASRPENAKNEALQALAKRTYPDVPQVAVLVVCALVFAAVTFVYVLH